ncbi:hypothetical protein HWI92_10005 [Dyadobacter sandarakinus]|uniref:FecR N-terminal domain-containing protein n=2 Tax=Dyadobacter sandarakinus TaxID=2747268 RepID=A0ABX7IDB7_9BACT|nr:hypothetical protein HWI92_10005 [Dyadobacter sandarakinus]
MKPFSELSAEELAMENLFIRWVRFPDDPSVRSFWEGWINNYPSCKETVERARELVLLASDWKPDTLTNQEVNSLWGRIRTSLDIRTDKDSGEASVKWMSNARFEGLILLIMSLTVLVFLIFFFFKNY